MDKYSSLEAVLTSAGRIKIMKLLLQAKELNISEITRRTMLAHQAVNKHLKILPDAGLVQEENLGKMRIFRLNERNKRCQAIRQLFEA